MARSLAAASGRPAIELVETRPGRFVPRLTSVQAAAVAQARAAQNAAVVQANLLYDRRSGKVILPMGKKAIAAVDRIIAANIDAQAELVRVSVESRFTQEGI